MSVSIILLTVSGLGCEHCCSQGLLVQGCSVRETQCCNRFPCTCNPSKKNLFVFSLSEALFLSCSVLLGPVLRKPESSWTFPHAGPSTHISVQAPMAVPPAWLCSDLCFAFFLRAAAFQCFLPCSCQGFYQSLCPWG